MKWTIIIVAQWTTNGGRLGDPVNIEWSVEVMCCAHFTIFPLVDVIYLSIAKVVGLSMDHPDASIGGPANLTVASENQATCYFTHYDHIIILLVLDNFEKLWSFMSCLDLYTRSITYTRLLIGLVVGPSTWSPSETCTLRKSPMQGQYDACALTMK